MPAVLKPIKRVWKPKVPAAEPMKPQFDSYGNELPLLGVLEKNSDSIWDTYEALQAAEAERVPKLAQQRGNCGSLVY
jgi:hypothetical protein